MAQKRSPRHRTIPPHFATGAEHAAATSNNRYIVDIDGTRDSLGLIEMASAHLVIRDQQTGEITERCKTCTHSEVEDRVAQLNRGNPTPADNRSWGKLTKERARAGKGVKRADPSQLSITEWVERLVAHPPSAEVLRDYVARERSLPLNELTNLLRLVAEPDRELPNDDGVEAISMQLYRKFGIHRAEDGRRART